MNPCITRCPVETAEGSIIRRISTRTVWVDLSLILSIATQCLALGLALVAIPNSTIVVPRALNERFSTDSTRQVFLTSHLRQPACSRFADARASTPEGR